jgi:DNA-binding transcriptional MerR regulator
MASKLYTIGEVAELTGVPIKTIRYYADAGVLPPASTTQARYRLYSADEIWRLELVRTLRYIGFGLDEIKRILAGDVDIATAIAWQLEALDSQLAHLTRTRDLLRQAQAAAADEARSLTILHAIGQAVTYSAEARGRFLADKLGAAIGGEAATPPWIEQFVRTARQQLPTKPTPEQAAAWAELIALLDDPDFAAASRAHVAPFWTFMRERRVDRDTWQADMTAIGEQATALLREGATPDTPAVQALAHDWANLFARAMGQPCDAAFLRRFATQAPSFIDERARRILKLLERAGWSDGGQSSLHGQQLVLDGLLALVRTLGA